MRKLSHTFTATDGADRGHTIRVFSIYTAGRPGQPWVDSGARELETADGQAALWIGTGEYLLPRDGTVVWTNDPLAP